MLYPRRWANRVRTISNVVESAKYPLISTIAPSIGATTPVFSRATIATMVDHEGLVKTVRSGEARFEGARRVENLVSSLLSSWTKSISGTGVLPVVTSGFLNYNGSTDAYRVELNRGAGTTSGDISQLNVTFASKEKAVGSVWIKSNTGASQQVNLRHTLAISSIVVTVTTSWQRFSTPVSSSAVTSWNIAAVGSLTQQNIDILVSYPQVEEVTGQSNQNPSEYVSSGVLASPYHGTGVDGVRYFDTTNGNTVASSIITESTGSLIPNQILKGYYTEGARTNLFLRSAEFDNASWFKTNLTVTANPAVAPSGEVAADLLSNNAVGAGAFHYAFELISLTQNTQYTLSFYVKYLAGSGWIWLLGEGSGDIFCYFNVKTGVVGTLAGFISSSIEAIPGGYYRCSATFLKSSAAASEQIGIGLTIANTTNSWNSAGLANQEQVYVWGGQLEVGGHASSYIPTTSATVTRDRDSMTISPTGIASNSSGAVFCEYSSRYAEPGTSRIIGASSGANTALCLLSGSAIYDGVIAGASFANYLDGNVHKIASRWESSGKRAFGDGVMGTQNAYAGSIIGSNIIVGNSSSGTLPHWGTVRNLKLWNTNIPDARIQQLTLDG